MSRPNEKLNALRHELGMVDKDIASICSGFDVGIARGDLQALRNKATRLRLLVTALEAQTTRH